MKLYEYAPTRSIRVRWALQELGVPFEAITVDLSAGEHQNPAFKRVNPAAKLPTLIDGDMVLTESAAILLYLGEKFPEKGLVPRDLHARAQHNRWLLFTVTELEQPLWRIARNTRLYPEQERNAADIPLARRDFTQMAAVLEAHMRGREFIAGQAVSMCDFALAHTLDWANHVQLLADCPQLLQYMERMYARPAAAPRITQAFEQLRARAQQ